MTADRFDTSEMRDLKCDELVRRQSTVKADARETGCSIHLKFERKVDIATTMRFITMLERAPGMLVNALRLLLGEEQVIDDE